MWHLVALGIPVLVLTVVLTVDRLWGVADPSAPVLVEAGVPFAFSPLMLVFMILVGGGMEEPGWRGFAQIRLLRRFTP